MPTINRKRGLSLVEIAFGIGIASLITLGGIAASSGKAKAVETAETLESRFTLEQSAKAYVKRYREGLISSIPVGGAPVAIRYGALNAAEAIPQGPSKDLPSIQGAGFGKPYGDWDWDTYGMFHILLVRQPSKGVLEGLVIQYAGEQQDDVSGVVSPLETQISRGKLGALVHRLGPNAAAQYDAEDKILGKGWQAIPSQWVAGEYRPMPGRAVIHISNQQ